VVGRKADGLAVRKLDRIWRSLYRGRLWLKKGCFDISLYRLFSIPPSLLFSFISPFIIVSFPPQSYSPFWLAQFCVLGPKQLRMREVLPPLPIRLDGVAVHYTQR
jgi:hypothetical protein